MGEESIRRKPTLTEHASPILQYRGKDTGVNSPNAPMAKIVLQLGPAKHSLLMRGLGRGLAMKNF